MKEKIITALTSGILSYFAVSWLVWDFNVSTWGRDLRIMFVVLWIFTGVLIKLTFDERE
jgi:hypothetical protein